MPRQISTPEVSRDSPYPKLKDLAPSRVKKACDRCRRKKSKCDGANPCQKCKAENVNCIFGDRKRHRERVYPKGYTNFLEEQQSWLIHGIRELYRRLQDGDGWPGEPLHCEANGKPLVHDMLSRLGSLNQPGITYLHECGHNATGQNPPHRQNLQDDNHQNTPESHPSNGSPEHSISVQALPLDLSNTLSSPMPHQAQEIELDGNNLSPFANTTQNVAGIDSIYDSPQTHQGGNSGQCNEPYTNLFDFESASQDEPSYNEAQISSPMLECPIQEVDSVGSDLFAGIAIHPADWDAFLNPSINGQLSTDGYWTPFYDTQAMPFEYSASA